jgi:hypothetical protein
MHMIRDCFSAECYCPRREIQCNYIPSLPDHRDGCFPVPASEFEYPGTRRKLRQILICPAPEGPPAAILFFPWSRIRFLQDILPSSLKSVLLIFIGTRNQITGLSQWKNSISRFLTRSAS